MLLKLLNSDSQMGKPKEGELYREVTVDGNRFCLFYGYYEESDRNSLYNDPIPIYPDLIQTPVYTKEGIPIVTAMQDVCERYHGKPSGESCNDCIYFRIKEELFGVCNCLENRRASTDETDVLNE